MNLEFFLQQYIITQIARTALIALIIIALLFIFNIFFLKKPLSLHLAFITILPLIISGIIFVFSRYLGIKTGGLYTVGLVWVPFFINSFYIIAALNKEGRIITNTNDPEFLLKKELIRDTILQDVVMVIAIAPLYLILPFNNYISLIIGGVISLITMWISYYTLIRKI